MASGPAGSDTLASLRRALSERARLTPAGVMFMVITVAVGILAFETGNNPVFGVFSILLAFLALSRVYPWLTSRGLGLTRTLPGEIFAGKPATILLSITNRNRWLSSYSVSIRDLIDVPGFREGPFPFCPRIPARKRGETAYTVRFRRRGRYRAEAYEIECAFPFGFFTRLTRGRDPAEFIVLPKPRPIRRHILPVESGTPCLGVEPAPWLGEEEEFKCLRPYRPGDPLRKIHWKTTARVGELTVRVMENLENRRASVLLDTYIEPGTRRFRRGVSLERGVRVAASLAADLEKRGFAYRLGVFTPEPVLTSFGRGWPHLLGILKMLAVLEPTPAGDPGELVREAASQSGPGHNFIVLLLNPKHAKRIRERMGAKEAGSVRAFDVSRPGLPRVL